MYKKHKPNTGGLLNELNGKMAISSPKNSVPVIKLINVHQPKSYDELESLIEYHYTHDCDCGIKSKGTVYDFGKKLYDSQKDYFGDILFTLEECVQWEYDLFIINSLKGNIMEHKAITELKQWLPMDYDVVKSNNLIDEEYRVDLEIVKNDELLLGIQVKPYTYKYARDNVKGFNETRNSQYTNKVAYYYYDENGIFINIDEILHLL